MRTNEFQTLKRESSCMYFKKKKSSFSSNPATSIVIDWLYAQSSLFVFFVFVSVPLDRLIPFHKLDSMLKTRGGNGRRGKSNKVEGAPRL
jgi:hypothetical protein